MTRQHNLKRKMQEASTRRQFADLAKKVRYFGSPLHKRNPGDFGLSPPATPCPDKTLCDVSDVFDKELAQRLLTEGVARGLVSEQFDGEFPRYVWSVSDNETPLEARLENRTQGHYHGHPLVGDPFGEIVLQRWNQE